MQFQSQVAEMEEGRTKDVERIAALEAALEGQATEARAAVEAVNHNK
jgi:flagellar biosynthesis regulator FlaF